MSGEILDDAFVWRTRVHWDMLDALEVLHNARYVTLLERARVAWYEACGHSWTLDVRENPDQLHVVRHLQIEFLAPFRGTGALAIELWVERIGTTSCRYGFAFRSGDHETGIARGSQTIVKLNPETRRPAEWTDAFRREHRRIEREEAR